ncbi:butyrophilin-like protein 10 isoform X2 [Latimeria chalumnae]|uniref:butyrophilin-like protein 10 isoform X2 n=1 Tax=Latimeria chalumnae TaxID=7897 RepID=UPI0003C16D4B|nr:PREDICTED: butyrophilin-like protein 10 isoform X2 [Latimeria chalumnae]|eukprot:XP_005992891.1 PREDICTED: butyrophilin-like protein 10 isoform X2 [Latimeria chalumnae]
MYKKHHGWLEVSLFFITLSASSASMSGIVGQTVILPCSVNKQLNKEDVRVYWQTPSPMSVIHVYNHGKEEFELQNPAYKNRTHFNTEQVKHGQLSLTLSDLRLSDKNTYECYFQVKGDPIMQLICKIELKVAAHYSAPLIQVPLCNSSVFNCSATDGYPEPKVYWIIESEEGIRTVYYNKEETSVLQDSESGLYSVASVFRVNVTQFSVTCVIENEELAENKTSVLANLFYAAVSRTERGK